MINVKTVTTFYIQEKKILKNVMSNLRFTKKKN